ncbi:hypothetical protein Tco_0069112, partial [Tanacetum coccineum]
WSQELLANASASCPKAVNKRDKFIATKPVTKKKRVTTLKRLTNEIKKKVEDHPRNNKSKLSKKNHVDSCTCFRSTVFDTNSNSLFKTCNECINLDSHDKCVDKSLKFSKLTLVRKIWRVKQVKQTWQPTGKLFTTVGHHWKPTGRTLPLGAQCPLTRKTTPKVVHVKIWKPTGRTLPLGAQCPLTRKTTPKVVLVKIWKPTDRIIPLRGQCPLIRPTALTSDVVLADPQAHHAPVDYIIVCSNQLDPNIDWGSNVSNSPFSSVFKCRSYNSFFGIWNQAAQNI